LSDETARLRTPRESFGEPSFAMLAQRTMPELLDLMRAFDLFRDEEADDGVARPKIELTAN
jgi:hypothetical protein